MKERKNGDFYANFHQFKSLLLDYSKNSRYAGEAAANDTAIKSDMEYRL